MAFSFSKAHDSKRGASVILDCVNTEDWVPCASGPLQDLKRLLEACQAEGIQARLWSQEACDTGGGCGCGPKIQLIAPAVEAARVAALMQRQWLQAVEREGTWASVAAREGEEPPCPACGSVAALEAGACPDCGLQLA